MTRRQLERARIPATTLERLTAQGLPLLRVAHGVYRLVGSPPPDHLELRAAWLQLAPEIPAGERTPADGVVSHRSAAGLYGIGHLPADRHEFTVQYRKQTRRKDVRLHQRPLKDRDWIHLRGLLVTRPGRIASICCTSTRTPEQSRRSSLTPFAQSSTTRGPSPRASHRTQGDSGSGGMTDWRCFNGCSSSSVTRRHRSGKEARESMMHRHIDHAPSASLPRPGSPA